MKALKISLILFSFIFSLKPVVALSEQADNKDSFKNFERREKTRDLCERNPNLKKCEKFLDAEYRRYSDVERDSYERVVIEEKKLEDVYKKEAEREFLTFCKKEPDAPRCQRLKSRPRLRYSMRTVRR